ncbi:carbohydrate esterase family 8 protein [Sesbania bispinosa]|nr:carbohydrate esterase family 8 protein [Sesbania bispinosa]
MLSILKIDITSANLQDTLNYAVAAWMIVATGLTCNDHVAMVDINVTAAQQTGTEPTTVVRDCR